MNKIVPTMTKQENRRVLKMFATLMFVSLYFTYSGASMEAVGFIEHASFVVFAIGATMAISVFWLGTWSVLPRLDAGWARATGWGVVVAGMLIAFNISSLYNAKFISQGATLVQHLASYIHQLDSNAALAQKRASQIHAVQSALRTQSDTYFEKAESERLHGAYTGSAGRGAVYWSLLRVKDSIDNILREVDAFLQQTNERGAEIRVLLDEIRQTAASDRPYRDRVTLIGRYSDELRRAGNELDPTSIAGMVDQALSIIPQEMDGVASISKNKDLARRQTLAFEKLGRDIDATASVLRKVSKDLADGDGVVFEAFEQITGAQSIYRYYDAILPALIGGLALDISPIFILIYACLQRGSMTRAEMRVHQIGQIDLEDILLRKDAEQLLRQARTPTTLRTLLDDEMYGRPRRESVDGDDAPYSSDQRGD
ncbi:hypothetical protein [Pyruvatibacter mobilis]|uniref:hypothetical protein n=1 Tax=Pyruvatibacter mobilis TaxID=1712261 RepID=UPI003C7BB883